MIQMEFKTADMILINPKQQGGKMHINEAITVV
jgi:hypothetical protein